MSSVHARARPALAAGMLLCCAGCGVFEVRTGAAHSVALPVEVTAAIASGALAAALGATPADAGGAAPISALGDGGYIVSFVRDRDGHWFADTDGRIAVRCDGSGRPYIDRRAGARRSTTHRGADDAVTLQLRPGGAGTIVQLAAGDGHRRELQSRLERVLDLASDAELAAPGLAEPNLAAWRLAQLIGAARRCSAETPQVAADLLRRATRLPQAPACAFAELAELSAGIGDRDRAIACYQQAALLTRDPLLRGAWSHAARHLQPDRDEPAQLRSSAVEHLAQGQAEVAESLLHSARRSERTPKIDYLLLARAHRIAGDDLAALAAGLLAREFGAPDPAPQVAWQQHLSRTVTAAAARPAAPPR